MDFRIRVNRLPRPQRAGSSVHHNGKAWSKRISLANVILETGELPV
jgi:hypothetical protein